MPINYHIVKFLDEGECCEIVHDNWIIDDCTSFWPHNILDAEKYRLNGTVNENWMKVNIKILYSSVNYPEAVRKLNLYLDNGTTELESDLDSESRKMKSRRRRKRHISSESEEEVCSRTVSKITFPSFSTPSQSHLTENLTMPMLDLGKSSTKPSSKSRIPSLSNYPSSGLSELTPVKTRVGDISNSGSQLATAQSPNLDVMTCSTKPGSSRIPSLSNYPSSGLSELTPVKTRGGDIYNSGSQLGAAQSTDLEVMTNLNDTTYIERLFEKLRVQMVEMREGLHLQMQIINENVKEIRRNQITPVMNEEEMAIYELLPVNSKPDFNLVDEKLGDISVKKTLIRIVASKAGQQRDSLIGNSLKEIMTDEFSTSCNFSGLNNKIGIQKSWIYRLLFAVLQKSNIILSAEEIKQNIQLYLKKTADSINQRKKRARISATNALALANNNRRQDDGTPGSDN